MSGQLYIVSAPSGAGKSSLLNALMSHLPRVKLSVSTTTRAPRDGEEDGVHYNFLTLQQFEQQVGEGAFYEHAKVFDNYYGTSKTWVQAQLDASIDVILEIDWQGAQQMRKVVDNIQSIFILPPSVEELENRLRGRGQDSEEIIQRRMSDAKSEISHYDEYNFVIVNDDFDQATAEIKAIFMANRLTLKSQQQNQIIKGLL